MRRLMLLAALVALLATCAAPTGSPSEVADADVTITASELAFDTDTLTIDAGRVTTVAFVNEDQFPHNWSIYRDESTEEKLFAGGIITDRTIVYDVPALEPGEYFFQCDLHPEMNGTLVVEG